MAHNAALSIRIPVDIKIWLAEKATENHRSLNSEIVVALKKQIRAEEAATAKQ